MPGAERDADDMYLELYYRNIMATLWCKTCGGNGQTRLCDRIPCSWCWPKKIYLVVLEFAARTQIDCIICAARCVHSEFHVCSLHGKIILLANCSINIECTAYNLREVADAAGPA